MGRVIFIPLVLLCVSPSPTHPVLGSNVVVWAVLFTLFLGFSNGYFGSLPLIHLSAHVKQDENKELAGEFPNVYFGGKMPACFDNPKVCMYYGQSHVTVVFACYIQLC